jgi:hypothetical protein
MQRYRSDAQFFRNLARILFMVPAAVVYFFVHIVRRAKRWYYCGAAQSWPAASATVISSYQIDENQVPFSTNGWDDEDLNYEEVKYKARWAVAIEYSYHAEGESYAGTYFLPGTYAEGDRADDAGNAWTGKTITVRYNPSHPKQSFFLEEDGAPGKPHIPRLLSFQPYLTDLSLK